MERVKGSEGEGREGGAGREKGEKGAGATNEILDKSRR